MTKNRMHICFFSIIARGFSVCSKAVIDLGGKDGELRVFVVAGEVSGDTIASRLIASLKKLSPLPIRFSGVGGAMMCKQGLKSVFPMEDIAVMGIWELLPHLSKFRIRLKETVDAAFLYKPHVVVTVDSKGFSFRFLKQLREKYNLEGLDSPAHFHYVAPSFWAWKGGEARLKGLAKFVDHLLCILPNEDIVCKSNGVDATFVGHPVLEDVLEYNAGKLTTAKEWKIQGKSEDFCHDYKIPSGATAISVLPGSRLQEVDRMIPIFARTMEQLRHSIPELLTIIHVAPNKDVENYINIVRRHWPVPTILIPGGSSQLKYDAFSASRAALCTSGTVAVELQLARLPCVVAYRAHFLTEWFIRYKAKIPYISLPNILLDSAIIPESLFQACTEENLGPLLMKLITDADVREEQVHAAERFVRLLSPSHETINNLEGPETISNLQQPIPSMLAASTILGYVKRLMS